MTSQSPLALSFALKRPEASSASRTVSESIPCPLTSPTLGSEAEEHTESSGSAYSQSSASQSSAIRGEDGYGTEATLDEAPTGGAAEAISSPLRQGGTGANDTHGRHRERRRTEGRRDQAWRYWIGFSGCFGIGLMEPWEACFSVIVHGVILAIALTALTRIPECSRFAVKRFTFYTTGSDTYQFWNRATPSLRLVIKDACVVTANLTATASGHCSVAGSSEAVAQAGDVVSPPLDAMLYLP
ncbi:unnamed protein product [Parajaminaea phylloscopi]